MSFNEGCDEVVFTAANACARRSSEVFTTVAIHRSGKVVLSADGFNDAYGPTKLIKRIKLAGE